MAKVKNKTSQANQNFKCDYKSSFTLIFIKGGYRIRKYKRYIDDPSVPVPKSTKLDRSKRSATRSNTAISIPQSVVSTELEAGVPTEQSASHKGEAFVHLCVICTILRQVVTNGVISCSRWCLYVRFYASN